MKCLDLWKKFSGFWLVWLSILDWMSFSKASLALVIVLLISVYLSSEGSRGSWSLGAGERSELRDPIEGMKSRSGVRLVRKKFRFVVDGMFEICSRWTFLIFIYIMLSYI